jgi:hypothetical protein
MSRFSSISSNRRVFMMQVATAATAVMAVSEASAQAMVDEKDPQAVGLAYKVDATKVDKAKNPKFAAGSNCANCAPISSTSFTRFIKARFARKSLIILRSS